MLALHSGDEAYGADLIDDMDELAPRSGDGATKEFQDAVNRALAPRSRNGAGVNTAALFVGTVAPRSGDGAYGTLFHKLVHWMAPPSGDGGCIRHRLRRRFCWLDKRGYPM